MKKIFAMFAGLAAMGFGVGAASAASSAYCALYAKEITKSATLDARLSATIEYIHDRAYSTCLNMDDEPLLPETYAGSGVDGVGGPFVEGSSVFKPALPSATSRGPAKKWRGSGFAVWSDEWMKWCAEHFPNSFDPENGTVVPYETGKRTMCR